MEIIKNKSVTLFHDEYDYKQFRDRLALLSGNQWSELFRRHKITLPRELNAAALRVVLNSKIVDAKNLNLSDEFLYRLRFYPDFSEYQLVSFLDFLNDTDLEGLYRRYFVELLLDNYKELHLTESFLNDAYNLEPLPIESLLGYCSALQPFFYDYNGEFDAVNIPVLKEALEKSATSNEIREIGSKYGVRIPKRLKKEQILAIIVQELKEQEKLTNKLYEKLSKSSIVLLQRYAKENNIPVSVDLKKTDLISYLFKNVKYTDLYKIGPREAELMLEPHGPFEFDLSYVLNDNEKNEHLAYIENRDLEEETLNTPTLSKEELVKYLTEINNKLDANTKEENNTDDSRISSLEETIEALRKDNQIVLTSLQDKDKQIADLLNIIEEERKNRVTPEQQLAMLDNSVVDVDARIIELENKVKELENLTERQQSLIADNKEVLNEKDNIINDLLSKNQVEIKEVINTVEDTSRIKQLEEKNAEIRELKELITKLRSEAVPFNESVDTSVSLANEEEIKELRNDLESLAEKQISELESRDERISTLAEDLRDKEVALNLKEEELLSIKEELRQIKEQTSLDKASSISELESRDERIFNLAEDLRLRENNLAEKSEELEELRTSYKDNEALLNQLLEAKEAELLKVKEELSKLQEESAANRESSVLELESRDERISNLAEDLRLRENNLAEKSEELEELKQEIARLLSENEINYEKYVNTKQELDSFVVKTETELKLLEEEASEASAYRDNIIKQQSEDLERLNQEHSSYKEATTSELARVSNLLDELKEQNAKLHNKNLSTEETYKNLLNAKESEIITLRSSIDGNSDPFANKVSELTTELANKETELAELKRELAQELEKEKFKSSDLEAKIIVLEREIQELSSSKESLSLSMAEKTKNEESVSELNSKISNLESVIEIKDKMINELKTSFDELSENAIPSSRLDNLEAQYNELVARTDSELAKSNELLLSKDEEIVQLQEKISKLLLDKEELIASNKSHHDENASLTSKLKLAEEKARLDLTAKDDEIERLKAGLNEEELNLNQKITSLQEELNNTTVENHALLEEKNRLQEDLSNVQVELVNSQVTSQQELEEKLALIESLEDELRQKNELEVVYKQQIQDLEVRAFSNELVITSTSEQDTNQLVLEGKYNEGLLADFSGLQPNSRSLSRPSPVLQNRVKLENPSTEVLNARSPEVYSNETDIVLSSNKYGPQQRAASEKYIHDNRQFRQLEFVTKLSKDPIFNASLFEDHFLLNIPLGDLEVSLDGLSKKQIKEREKNIRKAIDSGNHQRLTTDDWLFLNAQIRLDNYEKIIESRSRKKNQRKLNILELKEVQSLRNEVIRLTELNNSYKYMIDDLTNLTIQGKSPDEAFFEDSFILKKQLKELEHRYLRLYHTNACVRFHKKYSLKASKEKKWPVCKNLNENFCHVFTSEFDVESVARLHVEKSHKVKGFLKFLKVSGIILATLALIFVVSILTLFLISYFNTSLRDTIVQWPIVGDITKALLQLFGIIKK